MPLELSAAGAASAFVAGAVSFLSPCVLPLVPAYVSYIVGYNAVEAAASRPQDRVRTFGLSLCFVLGFTTIFVILGTGATAVSSLLASYRYYADIASGALVIAFGLLTMGLLRPLWAQRDLRWHSENITAGPTGAFVLGAAFAFGWTPCIGPVLGAILAVSTTSNANGAALLAIYSLGLGVPFVLAALSLGPFVARMKKMRAAGRILQLIAGMVMVAMGIAMITGQLTWIAFYLLEAFPALGRIG